jgi:hypothetical protein
MAMNERIEHCLYQAGLTAQGCWDELDDYAKEGIEKFAELIIRECANHCDLLLDHKISSEWSRGTHDCSRAIKKHFGVS